ncbi:MAG: hypothetical protein O3A63_01990 [Proteobacteria bacterium]|nr:hypothetical protein [Pseudomonadota bacterium]
MLEQGEYLPLDLLLQEGRLSYADYEAWRNGEQRLLDEVLFGDPELIGQLLAEAERYLKQRGWQADTLRYEPWRSTPQNGRSQALQFSANRALNDCFHRRYRKPQDQPQLDLFTDSPVTSLVNGITLALIDRHPAEARRLLERLTDIAPDHARLGALEYLTEAAEAQNAPVDDIRAELHRLQQTLTPLADSVLGTASRHLLIPLWRRLSQALQDRPFDADEPELHLSYSAAQALDWPAVRQAVEHETHWQRDADLLLRHADACDRQHDFASALPSWFMLCWQFPQRAAALDACGNPDLRQQWSAFQDLDPDLAVQAFPAWLLLKRPGLTNTLPAPVIGDDGCPASYGTLYALQRHRVETEGASTADEMALRAQLKEHDPALFQHFFETIGV